MRRLPPLNALRAFEAAARHLSFAKAADELSVTPTAVSHQIRVLEEILAVSLFRRRPRPIALTETGLKLYPVLRDGFDRFAAAILELQSARQTQPVRVATTTAFASRWLLPRLADFRTNVGNIALEVHASEEPVDLRAGEADFAVRYARAPTDDLEWHELFHDRYVPVCSPRLIQDTAESDAPAPITMPTLIHFQWKRPAPHAPSWQRWFEQARALAFDIPSADPGQGLVFSEESHAIEAAIAGEGVVLASDLLIGDELRSGTLVQIHDLALDGASFYAVHLPESPQLSVIQAFVEWARSRPDGNNQ